MPGQHRDYSKSIYVSFDTTTQSFAFSDDNVRMKHPGNIVLIKEPQTDSSWQFDSATVDTDPGQFGIEASAPNVMIISDACTTPGTYSYTVTVRDQNNQTYTSPDPKIVNENPDVAPA